MGVLNNSERQSEKNRYGLRVHVKINEDVEFALTRNLKLETHHSEATKCAQARRNSYSRMNTSTVPLLSSTGIDEPLASVKLPLSKPPRFVPCQEKSPQR